MGTKVFLPEKFTLAPGQTKTVEVDFDPPVGLDANSLPVYSGKILISGSNGEELSVPYFGVGSDVSRALNPIFEGNFPQAVSTVNWIPIEDKP